MRYARPDCDPRTFVVPLGGASAGASVPWARDPSPAEAVVQGSRRDGDGTPLPSRAWTGLTAALPGRRATAVAVSGNRAGRWFGSGYGLCHGGNWACAQQVSLGYFAATVGHHLADSAAGIAGG